MDKAIEVTDAAWSDCKIAFGLEDPDALWAANDRGDIHLPAGWSLSETDGSGARWVVIFCIENAVPTVADGDIVLHELMRIGAVPESHAEYLSKPTHSPPTGEMGEYDRGLEAAKRAAAKVPCGGFDGASAAVSEEIIAAIDALKGSPR